MNQGCNRSVFQPTPHLYYNNGVCQFQYFYISAEHGHRDRESGTEFKCRDEIFKNS
jgi:hypothetical protein